MLKSKMKTQLKSLKTKLAQSGSYAAGMSKGISEETMIQEKKDEAFHLKKKAERKQSQNLRKKASEKELEKQFKQKDQQLEKELEKNKGEATVKKELEDHGKNLSQGQNQYLFNYLFLLFVSGFR